ncbi:hypothetical protein, partial [Duncaniella muris]|uniref:hypothetical protein n=1 Tax=Duncaniella muris TaxID=2094150 RepID=UPI003F665CF9
GAWGQILFTVFSAAIVTALNFGNNLSLLPKLSRAKINEILIMIKQSTSLFPVNGTINYIIC